MILEDIVLELRGFFDIIVHFLENLEDKLECLLVDVLDGNLNKIRVTLEPFSMASASSMYFMEATCCSLRLYSLPSTMTTTIKKSLSISQILCGA